VRQTLLDAAEALERVVGDQKASAELIQQGKIQEAMPPLSSSLQTWQVVREVLEKSAALIRLPLEAMEFPGGASGSDRILELISSLAVRLEEVKRSLSAEDWTSLADVVAYDLSEQAERWRTALQSLSGALETKE
jgi:hypothetical protein